MRVWVNHVCLCQAHLVHPYLNIANNFVAGRLWVHTPFFACPHIKKAEGVPNRNDKRFRRILFTTWTLCPRGFLKYIRSYIKFYWAKKLIPVYSSPKNYYIFTKVYNNWNNKIIYNKYLIPKHYFRAGNATFRKMCNNFLCVSASNIT